MRGNLAERSRVGKPKASVSHGQGTHPANAPPEPSTFYLPTGHTVTGMSVTLRKAMSGMVKLGMVALIFNELRGLILAAPVLYGLYMSGGTAMAIWLAFCALAGIALSVIVPLLAVKKLDQFVGAREQIPG